MNFKHLALAIPITILGPSAFATTSLNAPPSSRQVLMAQLETCQVGRLRSGQLAVRNSPGGQARAGLDNGDIIEIYKQQGGWSCVRVIRPAGDRLRGIEGWVNSNYVNCDQGFNHVIWEMIQSDSQDIARRVPRGICSR
jgi:hypothetical protein